MNICVIYQNEKKEFAALELKVKKKAVRILDFIADISQSPESVRNINEKCEAVFLTGFFPGTIYKDITLPILPNVKNIRSSLEFELDAIIPVNVDKLSYGFRILDSDKESVSTTIRLFAIENDSLANVCDELSSRNISVDGLLFLPLMISSDIFPELSSEDFITPEAFSDFADKRKDEIDEFKQQLPPDTEIDQSTVQSMYFAFEFFKANSFKKKLIDNLDVLPNHLKPVRHQFWKVACIITVCMALTCVGSLIFRHAKSSYTAYADLAASKNTLDAEYKRLKKQYSSLSTQKSNIQKIMETKPGLENIIQVLGELNQRIPDYMWITSFRSSNEIINISIQSKKDNSKIYSILQKARHYTIINLRKRRTHNNQFLFTVKLKGQAFSEI